MGTMTTVHNQDKNCHCWNWEECLFWDGASTVLAEKLNNVAHVCVGIAVKQEIALEKKESRLWGICFPGWILLPQTFHYRKIGRKVLLTQCFKTQWKSQIIRQMLLLIGVINFFGTTRNKIGEEMQTALIISSQIPHEVRDSLHWLLWCWSQSSWIPSSILPQLCLPFSAKPTLANGLGNPALGGCEAERGCPKAGVAPVHNPCLVQFVMNSKYKPPDKSRIWG